MKKRLLASLLSATILLSMTPMAFADEELVGEQTTAQNVQESTVGQNEQTENGTDAGLPVTGQMTGTCGATEADKVSWALTKNADETTYTLTISGTGNMADFTQPTKTDAEGANIAPWYTALATLVDSESHTVPITEVVVQDGVTGLGNWAFAYTQVAKATFTGSVKNYGVRLYSNCPKLTTVDWANFAPEKVMLNQNDAEPYEGAAIPGNLFDSDRNLHICIVDDTTYTDTLVVPAGVAAVGTSGFYGTDFQTVDFKNNLPDVKQVGYYSFADMQSIKALTIPGYMRFVLGGTSKTLSNAFSEMFNATSMVIEEGIEVIPASMARQWNSMETLRLPSTITKIENRAFDNAKRLHSVDMSKITGSLTVDSAFNTYKNNPEGNPVNCVFYVNSSKIQDVLTKDNWGTRSKNRTFAITNDGTFPADTTFESGKLATPVKDGYKFVDWFTKDGTNGDWGEKVTAPAANKTYYAKWETCPHAAKTYVASGNVITEKCADCGQVFGTATLTLPENLVYDGQAKEATVTYSEGWTGEKNLTVTYNEAEIAPVDAGTYTVKVAMGDAKVTQSMTIAQATPAITIQADKDTLTGGGDVVLTVVTKPKDGEVSVTCDKADVKVTANKENGTFSVTLPNSSETYTFTAAVKYGENANYVDGTAPCTVTVTYQSTSHGGGGSSRNNSYAVSTPKVDNGTVTINNGSTAKKGDTVTITVKPNEGYEIDKVTVTDSKGNSVSVTDKGDGKYSFVMPDSKVDVKATFVKAETKPSKTGFVDVPENSWYADAADFVAQRGLMSGVGENLFGGNQNTTRAMLMTILARMDGQDVTGGSTWYEKAMNWAKANGVSDGTMPEVNITREQLATMLYSYAKLKGMNTIPNGMALSKFSDADSISTWASEAVSWAAYSGIISGRSNGTVDPQAGATRAEMAVMLQQFVGLMEQ